MPIKGFLEKKIDQTKEAKLEEALKGKQRQLKGVAFYLVAALAAGTAIYHLYTAIAGPPFAILFRNIHWMLLATLIFIYYPATKKSPSDRIQIVDALCIAITLVLGFYVWMNWDAIAARAGAPTQADIILGALLVIMVIEAGRRTVGWVIVIVAIAFIIYAYFGQQMPGILAHRGYTFTRIFPYLYLTDAGVFGIPLGVSSRFILLFIIFGAFLDRCGAGIFFRDLSLALTGRYVGGPAKSSILFSAFIGSITGSSTANVVTTGTFTIPLMKRLGYKPAFAGAVEADASTGGQILPPVMGAAAFVMAEWLGRPYIDIMIAAAFPAFLYFFTSFFMVHFRALKEGLVGLPKEELPVLKDVLKQGAYYFAPLVMLVYMLFRGFSPSRAVFFAIVITIVLSWVKKETRMYPKDIIQALIDGVQKSLEVVAACAVAGIIIGMVTMTGLGLKFSTLIEMLSGGKLLWALPLTLIASLILGMGVPTTAKYIILATLVAPALVNLGAPVLAAHLFILYFGTDADITPPVGLAAYAAAGLAGAHPLTTGWEALKMGITAYIAPLVFITGPALLLIGTPSEIALALPTAAFACVGLGAAMQGYFVRVMPWWHRPILFAGSVMLMETRLMWDLIGLALVGGIFMIEIIAKKSEESMAA